MFSLSETTIDAQKLKNQNEDISCGAFVCFEGWIRNHNQGKKVTSLEYKSYQGLAIKEGNKIIEEALDKYEIANASCCHRIGLLQIGEMAIWVGVSAAHRDAAFKACRYILDQVKSRVPIWKNENWADGHSGWINQE